MGLLERITEELHPRAWPVGPGTVLEWEKSHGHDPSEFSPDEYGNYLATSNEVYAAAALRARLMSSLRLGLFDREGSDKNEFTTGPAYELLRHVNPHWTWQRLSRMDELSMCVWGMSYWAIEKKNGVPSEIWWMKPSRVKPIPDESGYLRGFFYEPVRGGPPIFFAPDEVVWFRYPNPIEEFDALSPLAAARLAADTASQMQRSNQALFKDGLQIAGIITPAGDKVAFSPAQATDLEKMLQTRFSGADRAHRWAVMRYDAQFRAMGVTPKDAEFSNGLMLTARQVWNAYGIPSPLLNDLENATLSNIRDLMRGLWENTMVPDAQFRSAEIQEQLLPMFSGKAPGHCEFDFSGVPSLQESASESWARERQAIDVGALTINEWRNSKGLPEVAWGNVYWAPVNKSAVTDGNSKPQGDTAPEGDAEPTDSAEPTDLPAEVPDDARALIAAIDGHVWRGTNEH